MKMGHKILLSFAGAVALMAVLGTVACLYTSRVAARLHDVVDAKLPSVDAILTLSLTQTNAGRQMTALMLRRLEGDLRAGARTGYQEAFESMAPAERRFNGLPHTQEAARAWDDARGKLHAWQDSIQHTVGLLDQRDALISGGRAKDDQAVLAADARCWESFLATRELYAPAAAALLAVSDLAHKEARASGDQGNAALASTFSTVAWTLILGAVLLLALGVLLARNIGGSVQTLVSEATTLSEAVASGTLDVRGDLGRLSQEFRPVVEGMNATMDAFARPLQVTVEYVTRISQGDLPPVITERYQGDFNRIKDSLNTCIQSLTGLIGEMNRMSSEHQRGDIDVLVDERRFQGVYRTMAKGVNDMVGAHIAVKKKAMGVFAEFGKGNFDASMETLPGKKAFVNEAIEQVRGNLKGLIAEMNRMSREHDAGDIDSVIDVQRFRGEFACVAQGINTMVAGHIHVKKKAMACVAEFGKGNFEAPLEKFPGKKAFINDTIEQVRARLKALIADANGLVSAAVAGQLSTRADASRHEGDFRKIVDGVNRTLDAVLAPIQEAAQVLERLAERDLRARVLGDYQGDHAKIQVSVNATAESLHDALSQVASAVDQVSSAATQIAASSQAVAAGASEQASSLTETTTSVQSVAEQTRHAADSAQQANGLVQGARTAATDGAAAVEQLQAAMGKIKQSAEGTSQIIKDVSEIAFQTNLLALNAAVEAARAGEAGRGFAVVAEEVRSLALRAKEAATKTEELIRQSVKQAGDGEVAATVVARKLSEIVLGVSKATDVVSEIAASANAQTAGISQVNGAISEMDKVTQQNAASAEESSSAASELSGQAEELAAMVGAFQLEIDSGTRKVKGSRVLPSSPKPVTTPRRPPLPVAQDRQAGAPVGARDGKVASTDAAFPMDEQIANLAEF